MVKIIEMSTPFCSTCKMIAPMVQKTVAAYPASEVSFQVLDATQGEGAKLAAEHKVTAVPTFFFFNAAGELAYRHTGAITAGALKSKIEELKGAK